MVIWSGVHLMASVGGLLVEHDGRALLIDAGVGPISVGPPLNTFGVQTGGKLLDSLATLGRSPADIEAVALTHLHNDHFGWAWYPAPGSDRPAFAGTDILVAEPEGPPRFEAVGCKRPNATIDSPGPNQGTSLTDLLATHLLYR
jgi:glyoxylase-like metal-dependent hydrolase (beta-lactamase superfamily II)